MLPTNYYAVHDKIHTANLEKWNSRALNPFFQNKNVIKWKLSYSIGFLKSFATFYSFLLTRR